MKEPRKRKKLEKWGRPERHDAASDHRGAHTFLPQMLFVNHLLFAIYRGRQWGLSGD